MVSRHPITAPRPGLFALSLLGAVCAAALGSACASEDAEADVPAAAVQAGTPSDANPAAPADAASRPAASPQAPAPPAPHLSEGERRAIAEARAKRAAANAPPAADPDAIVVESAPHAARALRADDVRKLADDPAARDLPDPDLAPRPKAARPATSAAPAAPRDTPREPKREPLPPAGAGEALRPGVEIWPDGRPRLIDLAIATEIKARKPVNVAQRYKAVPELLMCFTAFGSDADTTVTHVWRHGDRVVSRVELSVGRSPSWRTWSRQRLNVGGTGAWSCEVLGPDGQRLGVARVRVGSS